LAIRILAALPALALAGCAVPPEANPRRPQTAGQVLAMAACPHRIIEANAWVNHMPGPGRAPRQLTVDVRFAEPSDSALVLKSAATTADTLVLDIRTTTTSAVPGRVGYREPVPDPLYKRISFFCRGSEVFSLAKIEQVY
jgi:hypothetical protein